jgi:HK97 family phage prohead protease
VRETFQATVPLEAARAQVEGRTMKGYAAVFNRPAFTADPENEPLLIVRPTAFDKTLKERAGKVRVLYQHGKDPAIGSFPLGVAQVMQADKYGLYTETVLDEIDFNTNRLIPSLRSGATNGMSITAGVIRSSWNDDRTVKYFDELALEEFGPVTFPLFEDTSAMVAARESWSDTAAREGIILPHEIVRAEASAPPGRSEATRERDRLTRTAEQTLAAQRERFGRLFGGDE